MSGVQFLVLFIFPYIYLITNLFLCMTPTNLHKIVHEDDGSELEKRVEREHLILDYI